MNGRYDPVMRFFTSSLAVAAVLAASPVLAQAPDLPPGHPPVQKRETIEPETLPEAPNVAIDQLFDRLKSARSPEAAQRITQQIEARWLVSGSDTIDLLMARVMAAMRANDAALSLDLLDAILTLKPDYAEGWHKRARVHFAQKDIGRSMADLEMALRLEPRNYNAMQGLAALLKEVGDKKRAIEVYRRLLAVHPQLPNVEKDMNELVAEVEGREL